MDDKIVASSLCGEIRIEAKMEKDETVSFHLFYLNTKQKDFDINGEPKQNFSIAGINAYFVNSKISLRRFLDDHVPFERDKIMRELREDLLTT